MKGTPMRIEISEVIITTTGSDGSATGSGTIPAKFNGWLKDVYVVPSAGQAATTDVVLKNGVFTLLTITNLAAAGQYHPRPNIDDEAGVAVSGIHDLDGFMISGQITITVAQADDTETVTVYVRVLSEDN